MELNDQELIEAVATEVMGWIKYEYRNHFPLWFWIDKNKSCPNEKDLIIGVNSWKPLTDINCLKMIIDKMTPYYYFELNNFLDEWYAGFYRNLPPMAFAETDEEGFARDKELGKAICLAALKAIRSIPNIRNKK